MHELSIAQAIVDQALSVCGRENGRRVLSGVEEHALSEAFPIACQNTLAEGSTLSVEIEEASVFCRDCKAEVVVTPPFMVCQTCLGSNVDFRKGRDMVIRQVKIEN